MSRRFQIQNQWVRPTWRRLGRVTLYRLGALGDELMMTAVAREIAVQAPGTRVDVVCSHPELFQGNPHIREVRKGPEFRGLNTMHLMYEPYFQKNRNEPRHFLKLFWDQLGLQPGKIQVDLHLSLKERELSEKIRKEYGSFLTVSTVSSAWTENKSWFVDRWRDVVATLSKESPVIHLGLENEPDLPGAIRLCGKTGIRESAVWLHAARGHLGVPSFLMHAANGVGTRSAIVFGGYELPSTGGYSENINFSNDRHCAPCWLRDPCPWGRPCMQAISAGEVIEAGRSLLLGQYLARNR